MQQDDVSDFQQKLTKHVDMSCVNYLLESRDSILLHRPETTRDAVASQNDLHCKPVVHGRLVPPREMTMLIAMLQ